MTRERSVVDVHPHQLDYRLLVEESLAGIYLVQDDRFLYVNPTMAELFGYTPAEIVRYRTVADLVAPADRVRVRENLRRRMAGEVSSLRYTFRGLRRDGTTFDVEVRGRRTLSNGEPTVIGTLLDVSDRTQERDRLRFLARAAELLDSSLDYETTLESLAHLMIPFLADLCFIDIREDGGVRRLAAGPWPGEVKGFSLHRKPELEDPQAGCPEVVLRKGVAILLEEVPPETSAQIAGRLPNRGTDAPLDIRSLLSVPLVARGEIIGAMTLATTVSQRQYRRQDLEFTREVARGAALAVDNARLYLEAQKAIQHRDDVLAVVSHDLRNPLNIIVMSVGMALEKERRTKGPLELVHSAAREMERLINDLLDISAIEAGGFSVHPKPQPLAPLVEKCLALVAPTAVKRRITIEYARTPGDDADAMIDEGRVVQAICNLLNNSVKFTPEGGLVSVSTHASDSTVGVTVRDNGPGIPSDQLDQVFDRFWQVEAGANGGAGLGLAIVRGIAEAHGGSARVASEPGRGSSFTIELPRA